MCLVNVAINAPIHRTFIYRAPEKDAGIAVPGMRVVVPFRKGKKIGYIVETAESGSTDAVIKEILSFPDDMPAVSKKLLKLIRWISDYYSAPIGEVFAAATPNLLNNEKEAGRARHTPKPQHDLKGFHKETKVTLTKDQISILKELECAGNFSVSLLHGVTGSGKTEIYLRIIEKVIASKKQAILLVPEISLTPQLAGKVASYFKKGVAVYHSGLTDAERLHQWHRVKNGDVNIVVGTRSAVFAPFEKLGVIIVDEEHDHSYKQGDSPRYNARDTAVMRGKIEGAPVILGSATPSIESLANARSGKYRYLQLPERHGVVEMPTIKVVDMRKEPRSELLNPHLSIELMAEIRKTVAEGHQVILFLNRRGFANFLICQDCGEIPACPNCRITLTYHKSRQSLICHYCNYKIAAPDTCPKCRGIDFINAGSGTEMIEDVIRKEVPSARIGRLDRDTATTEKKRRDILSRMHKGDIDILIGTQMITKGHDFPNVTLVGIVFADQSIHFPDFRSAERTFQLLTQVSGRAGRSTNPGKVIIQTYSPDHIAIKSVSENSLDNYVSEELSIRRELFYPPFSRIANIRISGNKEERVVSASKVITRVLEEEAVGDGGLRLLGPAPAPLAMIRGKARWQILVKSSSAKQLSGALQKLRRHIEENPRTGVQIIIDVDPVSMM